MTCDGLAGSRVECFECHDEVTANRGNRADEQRLQPLALADLPSHVARDALVNRASHHAKRFPGRLFRKQIEEGRLPKTAHQGLLERAAVELGLAGRVDEVREENGVPLADWCSPARV